MKTLCALLALVLLSGCATNPTVRLDVNRGYCPNYKNSMRTDVTIDFGNGNSIYLPIPCIKM